MKWVGRQVSETCLGVVAAATGAAIMMLELMGVRLAAPWFGQSQYTWTNVIGVVLASLAAGQWIGGRWAERAWGPGPGSLLVGAGAFALGLPDVVDLLSRMLIPEDLTLAEAQPFVVKGSLLVSLAGLGLPMLALGAVTPWLVRLSHRAADEPGRVAGRLLAAGTCGSLVGTFASTHILLPAWGSAATVRAAGLLLLAAGLLLAGTQRKRAWSWLALPLALSLAPRQPAPTGVLHELESAYQWARVVEQPDGSRWLQLNEGLDSFHSVLPANGLLTGSYHDAFVAPVLASPVSPEGERSVLVLGLGAGTMARLIMGLVPGARVVGVEIDGELIELGRRWFGLPDGVEIVSGVDARVALMADDRRHGAILLDAFSQQIYIPAHLATVEFFHLVRERLLPGGVLAMNVSGRGVEDPVVAALGETLRVTFPSVDVVRIPGMRNMLLLAWRDVRPSEDSWRRGAVSPDGALSSAWLTTEAGLGAWPVGPGRVLRDRSAPVEDLAHRSWRREWAAPAPGSVDGLDEPSALAGARRELRATRWTHAEHLLSPLLDSETDVVRVEAGLLLGNLAAERGDCARAVSIWESTLPDAGCAPAVHRALLANLADGTDELRRVGFLASAEATLERGILVLGVAWAALLAWCARRRDTRLAR